MSNQEDRMDKTRGRKVAVVTDSTADLPSELLKKYDIHVAPQILIIGETTWLDGMHIDPPRFYGLLRTSSAFPTTSQQVANTYQTSTDTDSKRILSLFIRCSKLIQVDLSWLSSAQLEPERLSER
jgi:fatty acid-binding protein DegV